MASLRRSEIIARWIEQHIIVPDGRLAGLPMQVHPWQREILARIYDRDPPARRVIVTMGRKNGKTTIAAAILLAHLCGPLARPGSQLVSAAQSREQAGLIYRAASRMAMLSPTIRPHVVTVDSAKRITCKALGTEYRALSADAHTAYGLSPALVIHDELGQVRGPQSDLYDALETAMAAHDDPLSIIISTQAPTDGDLLSMLIDAAEEGRDPRTVCIRYSAPDDVDPWSDEAIAAANPGLGTTCSWEELRGLRDEARAMPSREPAYCNLVLNRRVAPRAQLISPREWDACEGSPSDAVLASGPLWIGIDLSSRHDLTAMAVVGEDADGMLHVRIHAWVPSQGLRERSERDRAPYQAWVDAGVITLCHGATVSYVDVAEMLAAYMSTADVAAVAYDRWRIDVLQTELERLGVAAPLVPHGQGYRDMAPALDVLEQLVRERRILHGGNPLLRWALHGAVVAADPAGNRKLDKARASARIDALIALVMAVGVWSRAQRGGDAPRQAEPELAQAWSDPLVMRW